MEDCGCNDSYEKDWSKPSFSILMGSVSSVLVTIYGDMFKYKTLNGLYLSSSNTFIETLTTLDLYSSVKSISAKYPPITVFPLEQYDIVENYILQFKVTSDMLHGNYDIIYLNDAGYFKASNTKRFTYFSLINPAITSFAATNSIELSADTDPDDPNNFPTTLFNVFSGI